jgi:signal transduction histidine kinase
VVTGLAAAAMPLRSGIDNVYVIFALLQALAAAGSAAGGIYLRMVAAGRDRAVALVRAEQRAEFARDLHDFIAHHVTGIVVQAQGARFVAEQDPQRVIAALEQIERAGAETMASMRRMVGVLRNPDAAPDAPLAPLAGVADLAPLLDGFNDTARAPARLHVDGPLDGLPVEVSTSAYRVVMEGLTNTRQHAPDARSVAVFVRRTPDWLLVRVSDDGGTPRTVPARGHGFGLIGLTERVRALGGTITAGPGIAGGWVLDAALPLHPAAAR